MKEDLVKLISEITLVRVSEIRDTSSFESLGLDYFDISELIMIIENRYDFIAGDNLYEAKSVGELIKIIIDLGIEKSNRNCLQ